MRNKLILAFALLCAAGGSLPSLAQTRSAVPNTWMGSGAPVASFGSEGQWYLNTATGNMYGPKTNGAWGASSGNLGDWLLARTTATTLGFALTVPNPLSVSAAEPAASSCGTSPAVTAGSSNSAGQFTLGTSTPTACTITFATAWATKAFCTVSPASSGGAAISGGYYISAQSKTAFTLTIGTGTNSLVFNYTCAGN
jgi:hypothetical protein